MKEEENFFNASSFYSSCACWCTCLQSIVSNERWEDKKKLNWKVAAIIIIKHSLRWQWLRFYVLSLATIDSECCCCCCFCDYVALSSLATHEDISSITCNNARQVARTVYILHSLIDMYKVFRWRRLIASTFYTGNAASLSFLVSRLPWRVGTFQ